MILRPEILLHPNIPKPLHGMNPRNILGQKWWDEKRQEAYAKNDYHCWACGIHKSEAKYHQWLEAHECYLIDYKSGIAKMIEIVALCHSCHNFIHSGKLQKDLMAGRISREKFDDIMEHGKEALEDVTMNNPYVINVGEMADWKDWKLILEGKEYHSKFKNFQEWENYYAT